MDSRGHTRPRARLAATLAALGIGAAVTISIGRIALAARPAAPAGPAAPAQAAFDPATAPLPSYSPAEAAHNHVWTIPLDFRSRREVVIGAPVLQEGHGPIMGTALPQLELELLNRSGVKIHSFNAWHPLRLEHQAVPRPTALGPRMAADGADEPDVLDADDPRKYDPYHIIRDAGVGYLHLPFDPRVSAVRIVDLTLGGVELGRVSMEGAARRFCALEPRSAFCTGQVPKAALYIEPYSMTVATSQVFTLSLKARRMVDLYGGQLAVTYDPRVLQVVDQDASRPGAQIRAGDFPVPDTVLRNAANNATGRLEYYFTLTGEKPGVSGQGTVAYLVLRGVAPGRSLVAITETILSDPQSLGIPTKTENALITVLEGPHATVQGQVELERRPTSAGARVCSSGNCVTTAADGRFRLVNVPVGRPVDVSHPSYLRASRLIPVAATGTVTWPKVKLLAGDFDKDDRVDIVDAVMIGQRFNLRFDAAQPSVRWLDACDVTDDDAINILDMVAVQFNFLRTAPVPWPSLLSLGRADAERAPEQATRVHLVPREATADGPDRDVRLELRVEDVERLYGYRVRLKVDPAHLEMRDVSAADAGVQVEVGDFLDPVNSFLLVNSADNATGVLDLSLTQTAPAEGVSGSGTLAWVTVRGRRAGTSQVSIEELVLVNDTMPVPGRIPAETTSATVTVGGKAGIMLPWLGRQ